MLYEVGYIQVISIMEFDKVCVMYCKMLFDLILFDLQMFGMDGFQVMEGFKVNIVEDDYLLVLVIIVQLGYKLCVLQVGVKDFVSKLFDMVEVKVCIYNLIEVWLLYW